ncbi:MAG: YkgJ family cysteine cluster protein [Actinobacteria bacterium]|nr:YkgJ family cysteine cluster protein [Actinomycetota bacterium]
MTSFDLPASDQSICIGCGLCCDGTVVTHLAVRDESDLGAPLRGLGVEIIAAADPPVFALPCPAVNEGICTIHSLHRPSACAQFECSLSQGVIDETVKVEEARLLISATFALRDAYRDGSVSADVFNKHIDSVFRR